MAIVALYGREGWCCHNQECSSLMIGLYGDGEEEEEQEEELNYEPPFSVSRLSPLLACPNCLPKVVKKRCWGRHNK